MTARRNTRNALRATLQQEDAALAQRLPDVAPSAPAVPAPTEAPAPAAAPAAPPVARKTNTAVTPKRKAATPRIAAAAKPTAPVTADAAPAAAPKPARRAPAKPAAKAAPKPAKQAATKAAPTAPRAPARERTAAAKPAPAVEAPSAATVVPAADRPAKAGKTVSDTFRMPVGEHAFIGQLKRALRAAGRKTSKSELLRAGLTLLGEQTAPGLIARLDALPVVAKGKGRKR